MTEAKRTIRSLAKELKVIRERPVPQKKIDEFNQIVEQDKQQQEHEKDRKIARSPEAEI